MFPIECQQKLHKYGNKLLVVLVIPSTEQHLWRFIKPFVHHNIDYINISMLDCLDAVRLFDWCADRFSGYGQIWLNTLYVPPTILWINVCELFIGSQTTISVLLGGSPFGLLWFLKTNFVLLYGYYVLFTVVLGLLYTYCCLSVNLSDWIFHCSRSDVSENVHFEYGSFVWPDRFFRFCCCSWKVVYLFEYSFVVFVVCVYCYDAVSVVNYSS